MSSASSIALAKATCTPRGSTVSARAERRGRKVRRWGKESKPTSAPADLGMRNLAIVALTSAGASGIEVAALFELRPEYVSRLRGKAIKGGSAALIPPMGRPRLIDEAGITRAYAMADANRPGTEIAAAIGVSAATVSRLLARRVHAESEQLQLSTIGEVGEPEQAGTETEASTEDSDLGSGGEDSDSPVVARIGEGTRPCAYAGAMLLHGFLDRVGAGMPGSKSLRSARFSTSSSYHT